MGTSLPGATLPRPGLPTVVRNRPRPARDALRIALLCPVWFPVPPPLYGGIESVVSLLAEGLGDAGHDVTVFAAGDSRTDARLTWVYEQAPSERIGEPLPELRHVLACYERAGEFDVISDHTGPLAAALGGLSLAPVLHTVHGPLDGELGDALEQIARISPRLRLISLSRSQRQPDLSLPWVANCPNAIDPSRFRWSSAPGDYLAFLGRMGPDKGCHHAVAVSQETGLPLKIAAKCREPDERAYFAERIEWEEPFGLVMIESLACGTPVIATRRGSVPEVLEHGRTGIIVDSHEELVSAITEADRLDRAACRRAVEERFSPRPFVASYLRALRAAVESAQRSGARR
jgi:glycosyltransferase involved in cell wall biosynthesis